MYRSSKISLKFANKNKLNKLNLFFKEYNKLLKIYVDHLWNARDSVKKYLKKSDFPDCNTTLSGNIQDRCRIHACNIVRSTILSHNKLKIKLKYKYKDLNEKTRALKIEQEISNLKLTKPDIVNIPVQLDARFTKISLENTTKLFDGWVTIHGLFKNDKQKLKIPFKKHKHLNSLLEKSDAKIKHVINLIDIPIATIVVDIPEKENVSKKELGIDIGINSIFSTSENKQILKNKQGKSLLDILNKFSLKKYGSKSFKRCQKERRDFYNWCCKQLNLEEYSTVYCENIKNLNRGKKTSYIQKRWSYRELFDTLKNHCQLNYVNLIEVSSAYTSMRCSECGWTQDVNRVKEQFLCKKCGFDCNADVNAAKNIVKHLVQFDKNCKVGIGFYYNSEQQEYNVPVSKKFDDEFNFG